MNTKKTIYDKLFTEKVELAKHEVELAVIDDIKAYSNGYAKYISELEGLKQRGDRLKTELNDTISAIYKWGNLGSSMADDMVKLLSNFEKQAKDLGIDPKASNVYVNGSKKFVDYAKAEDKAKAIANSYIKIR
jgi:hypothetical protein